MRILLTGATGYLGRTLLSTLIDRTEFELSAVVRNAEKLKDLYGGFLIHEDNGSVESIIEFFKSVRPEVVIHLAAHIAPDPVDGDTTQMVQGNIQFGLRIAEGMRISGCRKIINAGTFWQRSSELEYDPVNLYAATKQAFQDLLFYYHRAYGFDVLNLRIFDTYGPNDHRRKLINLLHDAVQSGEPIEMTCGEQEINLVHISDVVSGIEKALGYLAKSDGFYSYSIRSPRTITIRELVSIMSTAWPTAPDVLWCKKQYPKRIVMQIKDELQLVPGWTPEWYLESGLADFYESAKDTGKQEKV